MDEAFWAKLILITENTKHPNIFIVSIIKLIFQVKYKIQKKKLIIPANFPVSPMSNLSDMNDLEEIFDIRS